MTRTAEKDIRSALRQLRGCIGRLNMAATAPLPVALDKLVSRARTSARLAEGDLRALLGAEGSTRR